MFVTPANRRRRSCVRGSSFSSWRSLPSQRPRRVEPRHSPLTRNQPPLPVLPIASQNNTILITILIAAFSAFLILPSIGTLLLYLPSAAGQSGVPPLETSTRIHAFFLVSYGIWGLILYTWACCQYSRQKGRAWWWGLSALSGSVALLALYLTGVPVAGVFSILGLAGVVIPLALGADPLQRITERERTGISSGIVLFAAFGLFVGISIAYENSFYGTMTLDNKYIIEEYYKTLIRQDPTLDVFSFKMLGYIFQNDYWWPKGISGLYRPLVTLSYWANYVYNDNKLDTFQYHVVNFFLHWFAAFLGFLLIRLLTKRDWIAFAAALLFVTHPIATESVSNIIGRADVMAACATFAGIILYIHSTQSRTWLKWVYLIALMIVTLLGVFAKESAIAIVGVMVVYDIVYRWTRDDLIAALPTLLGFCIAGILGLSLALLIGKFGFLGLSEGVLPALAVLLVGCIVGAAIIVVVGMTRLDSNWLLPEAWFVPWDKFFISYLSIVPPVIVWVAARAYVFYYASPPETPFLDNPIRGLNFFAARMTAMDVFARLLGLLVWPLKLSCDYSFNQIPLFTGRLGSPETWIAFFGALTLICLFVLAVVFYRRQKAVSFLILFYLVVYLPTSNFLIIIGSIMAERFLYLPLLAFTGCLVIGMDFVINRFAQNTRIWIRIGTRRHRCRARHQPAPHVCIVRNKDWLTDLTLWASGDQSVAEQLPLVSVRRICALFEQLNEQRGLRGVLQMITAERTHIRQRSMKIIWTAARGSQADCRRTPAWKLNSSRLYLHLGMYYSKKGDTIARQARRTASIAAGRSGASIYYRKGRARCCSRAWRSRSHDSMRRQSAARKSSASLSR